MSEAEGGGAKGGSSKKLLMLGVLGLVVLGGGGGGAWFFLKKSAAKKEAAAAPPGTPAKEGEGEHAKPVEEVKEEHGKAGPAEEEEEDEPAEGGGGHGGGAGGPAVLAYRNIVNLDRKNAYLKVEMHILFRDPDLGKAATSDKPTPENSQIRSLMLELLSGKTLEEVQDMETRESLRQEIKDRLNERFAPKAPKHGEKEKEDPKHRKPKKPVKDVLIVDWAVSA